MSPWVDLITEDLNVLCLREFLRHVCYSFSFPFITLSITMAPVFLCILCFIVVVHADRDSGHIWNFPSLTSIWLYYYYYKVKAVALDTPK